MAEQRASRPRAGSKGTHDTGRHCSLPSFVLDRLRPLDGGTEPSGSYVATSTAPLNVEDPFDCFEPETPEGRNEPASPLQPRSGADPRSQTEECLDELARTLKHGGGSPEIVIAVHGFSTEADGALGWYERIHRYVHRHEDLSNRNAVFLGYRWPSEKPLARGIADLTAAIDALPTLPRRSALILLLLTVVGIVVLWNRLVPSLLAGVLLASLLLGIVAALVIQRLLVYFRDARRASLFGTPDLVELVRQLDQALDRHGVERTELNFLGHSLGTSVITNAIRTLADAFAENAVGSLEVGDGSRRPPDTIGKHLALGRIVLVAPDIPVESVLTRRSNVLVSTLRRVKEAYVFSSEGDLALRLASTAANYISFPGRSEFSGYRLGNLTARHFRNADDHKGRLPSYGFVPPFSTENPSPVNLLELRASDAEHRSLLEEPFWIQREDNENRQSDGENVTDWLSYFDCTDYVDSGHGLLTHARSRAALNLLDYIFLLLSYLRFSLGWRGGVDTHGGYFRGTISQEFVYILSFVGFDQLLTTLAHRGGLESIAVKHQLQIILSPRQQMK